MSDYERSVRYIARKEDFQKSIVELNQLHVIGIKDDGSYVKTELSCYIERVEVDVNHFGVYLVKVHNCNNLLEIVII